MDWKKIQKSQAISDGSEVDDRCTPKIKKWQNITIGIRESLLPWRVRAQAHVALMYTNETMIATGLIFNATWKLLLPFLSNTLTHKHKKASTCHPFYPSHWFSFYCHKIKVDPCGVCCHCDAHSTPRRTCIYITLAKKSTRKIEKKNSLFSGGHPAQKKKSCKLIGPFKNPPS